MITITTNKNTFPGGKVLIGIIIAIFCLLNQGFSQKRPTQYDSTTASDIALSDIFINYDLDKVGDKTERISFYQLKQWLITQEIGYADSLKIVGDSLRLYQGTDSIAVDVSSLGAGGGGGGGGGGGTDDQTLSLVSNTLSIEDGNSVDLSGYLDNTDAQDLQLSGNTLSLTGDATTVDLSGYLDNTDTQLNESQVEAFIDGNEASFSGWDKNASDDFDGAYSSLSGAPSNVSTFTNDAAYIPSSPSGITGATAITNIIQISQANYDAIGTPDANTLYIIND